MPSRLTIILSALALVASLAAASFAAQAAPLCLGGRPFNPVVDPNWLDFLPITVMGVSVGPGGPLGDPPLMREPPICVCPSHLFGVPLPGIGVTFWEPEYLAEVVAQPGCMPLWFSGPSLLSGFAMEASEQNQDHNRVTGNQQERMQVHWYHYPIFAALDMFKDFACFNSSGVALAYMTEFDPTWQNDLWGVVYSPQVALFTSPLAQLACSVDAIASTVAYPLDALFWCQGTAGDLYPLTGNSQALDSNQTANMSILGKFLGKAHAMGMLDATIGPWAECFSGPSPLLIKSQYRIDPVWPIRSWGPPVYLGQSEFRWGLAPPANFPEGESSGYLVWQGQQCCLRF